MHKRPDLDAPQQGPLLLCRGRSICTQLVLLLLSLSLTDTVTADRVSFNRDILPILSDRCFQCHGPDEGHREAELRLDVPDGDEGALRMITPGNPEESELWQRITSDDEDLRMPPADATKKPISTAEQELFKQWILQGAKYEKHWSFVPPKRSPPPEVKEQAWRQGPIDPFVFARLQQEGLSPKPEADKRTLSRRVTFDLTGLPPSVEQIDAFLQDDSPEAYEKLVDRLLTDQAYGEHMARYWADLVRLADTNGMHKDFYRNFSTYRRWLIRAFNDNLRFDDFIKFQLAGEF